MAHDVTIPPDAKGLQVETDVRQTAWMSFYVKKDGIWYRVTQRGCMTNDTFIATEDQSWVAVQTTPEKKE